MIFKAEPPIQPNSRLDRAHRSHHVTVFNTNDAIALSMERRVLKQQAQRALERLMQNRTSSQQYHDDIGQSDPLSSVTGRSAIDRAIDTTREILNDIESVVQETPRPSKFNTMCNGLSRLRSRVL